MSTHDNEDNTSVEDTLTVALSISELKAIASYTHNELSVGNCNGCNRVTLVLVLPCEHQRCMICVKDNFNLRQLCPDCPDVDLVAQTSEVLAELPGLSDEAKNLMNAIFSMIPPAGNVDVDNASQADFVGNFGTMMSEMAKNMGDAILKLSNDMNAKASVKDNTSTNPGDPEPPSAD